VRTLRFMNHCSIVMLSLWILTACTTKGVNDRDISSENSQSPDSHVPVVTPKYETYVKAGQPLPLEAVETIDGKSIQFGRSDSRTLVILFATWCSDSQRAMKALKTSPLLKDKGVRIVAIARENTPAEVEQFKAEYDLTIDMVADVDRRIYKQFASAGIPRFIMVDEDNNIVNAVLAEGENQMDLIQW